MQIIDTACFGSFNFLCSDLQILIFKCLSSKDRSIITSVSTLFESLSIRVSKSLSLTPKLYCVKETHTISSLQIENILKHDYHLIVRLKNKELISLEYACNSGSLDIIELMIEKGANDWNRGLRGACYGGRLQIVELMIEKGANDWNNGLRGACYSGNLQIVELMIQKGVNKWNNGLYGACYGGNLQIVELMIEKGASKCYHCKKPISQHINV